MPTITLTWTDPNTSETAYEVYRADAPMDPGALPTPLAALGPNTTSYADTTVVADATYYYRIQAVRGTEVALGPELMAIAAAGSSVVQYPMVASVLLHFEGADASTTIMDESGKVWTAYGNAQIDTAFSRFGGSSLLLDGVGGYISTPAADDLEFGTGDFTVEGWIRPTAFSPTVVAGIVGKGTSGVDGYSLAISNAVPPKLAAFVTGLGQVQTGTTDIVADTWYHVAWTRSGGVFRMFLNGILESTYTAAVDLTCLSDPLTVGVPRDGSSFFTGSIEEFRVIKGVAAYTANFTPPTAPFTLSNTKTGTLLHFDGADASTAIKDEAGRVWTASGTAQIDTAASKFGGSALIVDGTANCYAYTPHSADLSFLGDFTVEAFFRTTVPADVALVQKGGAFGASYPNVSFGPTAGGKLAGLLGKADMSGTFNQVISTASVCDGAWHHGAFVRQGNTLRLFVDGVQSGGDVTVTVTPSDSAYHLTVGGTQLAPTGSNFTGSIDEVRIIKGEAKYTANFTPPALPFTLADTPTASLLHFDGFDGSTIFRDDTGKNWTAYGNAQVDTALSKFGGGALLLDGTGDYLEHLAHSDFVLGAENFTIEAWVSMPSTMAIGTHRCIASMDWNASLLKMFFGVVLDVNDSLYKAELFLSADGTSWSLATSTIGASFTLGQFYHIAGVRSGNNLTVYVDGSGGTPVTFTGPVFGNGGPIRMGLTASGTHPMTGTIDEFRLQRGVAAYTANFTPPTAPFTL